MITLLVNPEHLGDETIAVTGDAYRHLFRARRVAVGDAVRLVDGRGSARWGVVERVGRECGDVRLGAAAPGNEPELAVDLFVAVPKPERAAWLVEKVTEIGVRSVRFLATERAPRELGAGSLARLHRVAAAALQQCHGARLPEITGVHAWRELAPLSAGSTRRLALHVGPFPVLAGEPTDTAVAVLIGPEGGFAGAELAALGAADWRLCGLGERVLRVETAAVLGAGLLLAARS